MPRLVHLAPESRCKAIERAGIKAEATSIVVAKNQREKLSRAVYAMPIVPDFSLTYQWVRELRRCHDERMLAVHFVVPSDELVWVGRYDQPHEKVALSQAIRRVLAAPAGNEIILTRAIRAREVASVRALTQLVGWTEMPEKRGTIDCLCVACVAPGTRDLMRRVRAAFERHVLAARSAPTSNDTLRALHMLEVPLERARGRIAPDKLLAFAKSKDGDVRRTAVALLGQFRFADVSSVLATRLRDDHGSVREAAVVSLVHTGGPRRAWALVSAVEDDLVTAQLIEQLTYARDAAIAAMLLAEIAAQRTSDEIRRRVAAAATELLRDDELSKPAAERLTRLTTLA